MKNISDLLRTGNLTPKERILLCIHDEVNEHKTGTKSLTSADIHAVSTGWKPKNNYEVQEYNKYYHAWDALRYLKMDMQTTYLNAIIEIRSTERVLAYFTYNKDYKNLFKGKGFDDEALQEILRNTGFDYNLLVHKLTFDSLPLKIQKDVLALDPDASSSSAYFDDEEKLYEILKGKTSLTHDEVTNLTELILNSIPWGHLAYINDQGLGFSSILFSGYFASIPLLVFAEKLAGKLHIEYKDEEDLKAKVAKLPNLKHELRILIHDEVAGGLFLGEYTPLCNSDAHATCNDIDTKLPHSEIMDIWMEKKVITQKFLQDYIGSGKLVVEDRYKELFTIRKYYKSITGESLYYLEENLPFAEDYKKQIEKMLIFGCIATFIKRKPFMQYYAELLYFNKFLEKASKVFEVDVSFYGENYTKVLQKEIKSINDQLCIVCEMMELDVYMQNDIRHTIETYLHDIQISIDGVTPITNSSLDLVEKKVSESFSGWSTI